MRRPVPPVVHHAAAFCLGVALGFQAGTDWPWTSLLGASAIGGYACLPPSRWRARLLLVAALLVGAASVPASAAAVRESEGLFAGVVRGPPRHTPWGVTVPVDTGGVHAEISAPSAPVLAPGDRIAFRTTLRPPDGFANPGNEDRALRMRRAGVDAVSRAEFGFVRMERGRRVLGFVEPMRARVRSALDADFREPSRGVVRALVLGETASLAPVTKAAFRGTGTSHLLAVSGLHVVLFSFVVFGGLRALLLFSALGRRTDVGRAAALATVPAIAVYTAFAGAGASAVRAGLMATVVLLCRALGRAQASVAALSVAAVVQVAWDPGSLFDPGLQLSYAAVLALYLLTPSIERLLGRNSDADDLVPPRTDLPARAGRLLRSAFAANVATTLGTAPLVAHHFGLATPSSVVANLVGVPATSLVLLPASLLWSVLVLVGAPAAWMAGPIAAVSEGLVACLDLLGGIPGASLDVPMPGLAVAILWTATVVAWAVLGRLRPIAAILAVALAAPTAAAHVAPRLRTTTRVTFLDVGQGDAALVELPGAREILIDAGGLPGTALDVGEREVAPYLKARGVGPIEIVVLSHPHPDHFGGLPAVLGRHPVRDLWDNGQGEAEGLDPVHAAILRRVRGRGARVLGPADLCGRPRFIGGARLDVLGPCPAHDTGWGPNDNSLVVRLEVGDVRFLFPGDVEAAGESWLQARDVRADVVKVPHHGSRTSSGPALVSAAGAHVAVISSGRRNRFGHPAPEVVRRWEGAGTTVLRTDRQGAVVVETDGRTARIETVRRATSSGLDR